MAVKVGINGFGRIGRLVFRAMMEVGIGYPELSNSILMQIKPVF